MAKDRQTTLMLLCDGIKKGMTRKLACGYAGICIDTLKNWIQESPALENMLNYAQAEFNKEVLPFAIAKEPYKMLKAVNRGEYIDEEPAQTNVQVNINRPLINVPSETLLQMLKSLKQNAPILPVISDNSDSSDNKE